ncbi:hypothetical protein FJZ39_01000 [Candidatus Saccharibacteria bacterium]|nr:hypothetical protein [Candidatus Saccharibacteria bacterium]
MSIEDLTAKCSPVVETLMESIRSGRTVRGGGLYNSVRGGKKFYRITTDWIPYNGVHLKRFQVETLLHNSLPHFMHSSRFRLGTYGQINIKKSYVDYNPDKGIRLVYMLPQ